MCEPTSNLYSLPEPESIEQTALAESLLEHLILKLIYFRGDVYGQDLSAAIGLKFSVIQDVVESLKLQHIIQVKRSLGMGNVGAVFALTEAGRTRARECLEENQYVGPAPVPIEQYVKVVRCQRPRDGWLTKDALARAFNGMVITERLLSQIGPAVSSATSLLIYGKPGDGKTFLIESLAKLDTDPIFIPYALECHGNIIQVFDPIYHERIEEGDQPSVLTVSTARLYDRRWIKCRRPFIVTGGELAMDMLDLRYNETSKVYEAPYQLKANNGIYLLDDFGRQKASPAEVLNRWIVPMERSLDYLSFLSGAKMTVPFEAFMVFSTNLNPADLGDEAFLRRIRYKMRLHGPTKNEFIRIFEAFCSSCRIPCTREMIVRFIDRHYKQSRQVFRRCHPRDVLTHALNLIHFEKLAFQLTDELLDRAFESCFVQDEDDESVETPILPVMARSCSDFWNERIVQIPTIFGTLALIASLRDTATGEYYEEESARQFGEAETARVLARLHAHAFRDWLSLPLDRQHSDLGRYLASHDISAVRLQFEQQVWIERLTPAGDRAEEALLFGHDLRTVLGALCHGEEVGAQEVTETPQLRVMTPIALTA